jgi:hypothetical protein
MPKTDTVCVRERGFVCVCVCVCVRARARALYKSVSNITLTSLFSKVMLFLSHAQPTVSILTTSPDTF